MTLSIASNISSLSAQNRLQKTSNELSKVYERLSSGQRINKASDDPAGFALSELLNSQAKVATVAIRNANDGLSVTSIADEALGQIGSILNRLSELATQSANGSYSSTQRSALSSEFIALGSEIDRIAKTTTFNSISLLSNSSSLTLQVGLDATANSQITISSVLGTLSSLGLGNSGGVLLYSLNDSNDSSTVAAQSASTAALTAITSAVSALSSTRGLIGAVQSRLTFAIDNLTVQRENNLAANSRIRDADIASDAAELVRLQVLQEAGTAILAQANQQPQRALQLLQ